MLSLNFALYHHFLTVLSKLQIKHANKLLIVSYYYYFYIWILSTVQFASISSMWRNGFVGKFNSTNVWDNGVLTLVHRSKRWPKIKPAFAQIICLS